MELARMARALGDPVRLKILGLLWTCGRPPQEDSSCCENGVCVCHMVSMLGITQPRASYHLKILRDAELVTERPRGKWTYYDIDLESVTAFCHLLLGQFACERGGLSVYDR